jgi:hypothetical protein
MPARKRLRPPGRARREGLPRLLHQVRPVRAGVPGAGHQAGRPGRRLRRRRALHRRARTGLRLLLRRGAVHPGLPDRLAGLHKPAFLRCAPGAAGRQTRSCKAKENDPEPTLNLKRAHRRGAPDRPEACLAIKGKGVKGQAAAAFKGKMRYMAVDRWKPVPVADHPYDLPSATCACASARSRARSRSRPSRARRQQAQAAGGA